MRTPCERAAVALQVPVQTRWNVYAWERVLHIRSMLVAIRFRLGGTRTYGRAGVPPASPMRGQTGASFGHVAPGVPAVAHAWGSYPHSQEKNER